MKSNYIVFIALTDYDNLGVGYMASALTEAGFKTKIFDFRIRKSIMLKKLKSIDPLVIGFSVIFLNFMNKYIELIEYLRNGGLKCHFTAGGHYASLRYAELFKIAPELDSIIRFEGEFPIVELAKRLSAGNEWRTIRSLAFITDGKITANPVWKHERDIDKFPFPYRSQLKKYAFNKKFTAILAGRGCIHNCSFCNTRAFYRQASCPLKRIRKPEGVVNEMEYLFTEKDCSVFLFQDDDFPVKSKMQNNWIKAFCNELERTGLGKKVMWKMACRPDEIEEESFNTMKNNGLFQVFVGIEDGTHEGLKRLNKHLEVNTIRKGIRTLKKLSLDFDFGFILFQPETTCKTLNENLDFLMEICSDGYTPVTFLKLIPLYETQIEKELLRSGRLKPSDKLNDYDFPEEPMNRYYQFIMDCFGEWLRDPGGVENISKCARNYYSVYMHFFDASPETKKYYLRLRRIISESNIFLIENMKELSVIYFQNQDKNLSLATGSYLNIIKLKHDYFKNKIIRNMAGFLSYAEEKQIITIA